MAAPRYNLPITATDKTAAAFKSVTASAGRLAASAAKIGFAFATAGTAAAAALTKMSMANIDTLAKTADKIGVTTEALGGLRHAAELTGVSTGTMDMAMQRLTRRVSEAANGTGEAKAALQELGINAVELEKIPLDKQMEVIAEKMSGVKSQSDKVRLAMKLFDSEGVALVNTLAGGSAGLQAMAKEAEELGITVSRVDAAQIELANDAVTRAKGVFTGLGNQLATNFAPLIKTVADRFRQSALDTEDFGSIGQQVVQALLKGFGKFADAIFFLKLGFAALRVPLLEIAQVVVDKIDPVFTAFAEKYNRIAAIFGMDLIDTEKLTTMSANLEGAIGSAMANVAELMAQPLPSEGINATFEQIVESTRRAAEQMAENAPGKVMLDDLETNAPLVLEKMSFLAEAQMEGQKKLADFNLMSTTKQTQHVVGELATQFSSISKNNKKLFALSKAMNIASAIMNTATAATVAYKSYPPPINYVMAAGVIAAGLGQVAQIKAQSFDGGGMVPDGVRQGGADGIGGKFALLHPGEQVLTKKQAAGGGGVTIVNNVDAKGADAQTDMKIRQAMQQTSQQTVAIVQDLLRRGRLA